VVAFPESAPVKVVVDKLLVDGLNVSPEPKLKGWFPLVDDAANNGKKDAFEDDETVAPLFALVAVVAVVAEVAVVADVAVVAVVAFPESAPVKVVVDKLLVEGLNVSPVPKLNGWFPFEEEAANSGKNEAFEEDETVAPLFALVAVVAVVAEVAVVADVAVVAVVAFPERAPVKVVVDKLLVEGLNVSPVPKLNG
jgi:regulator of extracellular matrix RemA (YlzA/DUF370 family)